MSVKTWLGPGQAMGPVASPNTAGPGSTAGGWQPTVLYLVVLVLAEIFVVGLLSRTVLR